MMRFLGPSRSLAVGFASLAAVLALATGCARPQDAGEDTASPTASVPLAGPSASPSADPSLERTASPVPKSGDFEAMSMTRPRELHTATLLTDGRVLITGGIGGEETAELYDPATGTFSATGSMTTWREAHTATLLTDGRVLIVGGLQGDTSAELLDPETGRFTATGSMTVARQWHTATLLAGGRVLIAGGDSSVPGGVGSIASAEVYDPRTGLFSQTGSMTTARSGHTATLLPNGLVLIAGCGELNGTQAELYDPRTGKFSRTGSMTRARCGQIATLLADGRVLIAGGNVPADTYANADQTAELYDPNTGTFAPTGSMVEPLAFHTATLLPNGQVLLAGGESLPPGTSGGVETYDPASGTFSPAMADFFTSVGHTATLLTDGRILFAGGKLEGDTPLSDAWLFVP